MDLIDSALTGHSLKTETTSMNNFPKQTVANNNTINTANMNGSQPASVMAQQPNPAMTAVMAQQQPNPAMTSVMAQPNPGMKACAGCGTQICERFLLHAVDRFWHTGCLKCSCCHAQLGDLGSSCFAKGGMILCKNDYIRLFGSSGTCSTCGQVIPASEFVMKAQNNVYHLKCFTCMSCHCQLVPGDRFGLINGSLFCEHDYPKVMKGPGMGRGSKITKMRNIVY